MNEQTQKKKGYKQRRKFKALLNNRGIEWSEPSPGHFRIGDIVYFYRAKMVGEVGKRRLMLQRRTTYREW